METLDGGKSWQASQELAHDPPGGLDTPLYIDFINHLEGWLLVSHGAAAGSQPVSLYHTQDGGQTWLRILDMLSPLGSGISICCQSGMRFADPLNGIITTSSGPDPKAHVNWTADGGQSWVRQDLAIPEGTSSNAFCGTSSPTIASGNVVSVVAVCQGYDAPGQDKIAYLFRTGNFGQTWSVAELPTWRTDFKGWLLLGRNFDVQFLSSDIGWLFIQDFYESDDHKNTRMPTTIYQTGDGGNTWNKLSRVNWSGHFSFITANEGWALATNDAEQALVVTQDGGRSWDILEMKVPNE